MIWPAMLFNLCVGMLLAGYLLRGVRRFEHRADEVMAKLDRWHAERLAKIDQAYEVELRKYDIARDEIRESMREQVARAIAELKVKLERQPTRVPTHMEIRELPRWARVAFAARCARRVLPLVKHYRTDAPEHHLKALDRAVSIAEQTAARAYATDAAVYVAEDDEADAVEALCPTSPTPRSSPPTPPVAPALPPAPLPSTPTLPVLPTPPSPRSSTLLPLPPTTPGSFAATSRRFTLSRK